MLSLALLSVWLAYGMTEMTCLGAAVPSFRTLKPRSSGVPLPNMEIQESEVKVS